jgi:2',3'-cyclic-nucleotide 2'-phosphodiesterase (5'-nucleotidase family)
MSRTGRITFLQINDSHAYLSKHPELFWEGKEEVFRNSGGYARIAHIFNRVRSENDDSVIILDNGDTFHGTYPVIRSQGEALIPILNALHFDAMTAHWDFAYGPSQLKALSRKLEFPVLALNCYHSTSDNLMFPPYTIVERGGLHIGIIGIANTIVDKTMPPHFSTGIYLTLGKEELPHYIQELKDDHKVDLVVVLSHLGFPQDVQLASEIEGIDILLSGHTHNRVYDAITINNTILMQSGCHGSFVGRLDVTVSDGTITGYSHRLIPVTESIPPDPPVDTLVHEAIDPHQELLQGVLGKTRTPLHRYGVMETTMDNLLLLSLLQATDAELAFSNGWRYGAPVPPGPLTVNDLWNMVPTDPPLSLCEITGRELHDMMEENLEHTFSRDPYNQMGGYVKRCMGLTIYFKIENPKNHRIMELFVHGKRINPSHTYKCCFLTTQDIPEKYGENRQNLSLHAIEALSEYISSSDTVSSPLLGTIVPI